eukprot:scaffold140880_cov28-Prasinocladus_malaysianus.AAC.1
MPSLFDERDHCETTERNEIFRLSSDLDRKSAGAPVDGDALVGDVQPPRQTFAASRKVQRAKVSQYDKVPYEHRGLNDLVWPFGTRTRSGVLKTKWLVVAIPLRTISARTSA